MSEHLTLHLALALGFYHEALFSRSGGGPGAPWRGFFATLAPRCTRPESVAAPKTAQDAIFSSSHPHPSFFFFASFFRYLLGPIFGRFCTPTWHQKSTQIFQKSMPRCTPSWTPIFDRFLVDFCSQLRPSKSEKSSPRCSQSTILEKSPSQVNINF